MISMFFLIRKWAKFTKTINYQSTTNGLQTHLQAVIDSNAYSLLFLRLLFAYSVNNEQFYNGYKTASALEYLIQYVYCDGKALFIIFNI